MNVKKWCDFFQHRDSEDYPWMVSIMMSISFTQWSSSSSKILIYGCLHVRNTYLNAFRVARWRIAETEFVDYTIWLSVAVAEPILSWWCFVVLQKLVHRLASRLIGIPVNWYPDQLSPQNCYQISNIFHSVCAVSSILKPTRYDSLSRS